MKAIAILCLMFTVSSAYAASAYADEASKKNPWERFNKPSNLFNKAKPGESEPWCRDIKNCFGRDHLRGNRKAPPVINRPVMPDPPGPGGLF